MKKHLPYILILVALGMTLAVYLSVNTFLSSREQSLAPVTVTTPEAEFCSEAGGQLKDRPGKKGVETTCTFPNGESCEASSFFRSECAITGVVTKAAYTNDAAEIRVTYRLFNNTALLMAPSEQLLNIELTVATSGSGARYLSADGSIEFWEHQGEGTLSKDGKELFRGTLRENERFTPTETYLGTDSVTFEHQDYTSYRFTQGDKVRTGDLNTERGYKDDIDATVFILDWQKPENEQKIFVRKTGSSELIELTPEREEMTPKVVLKKVE